MKGLKWDERSDPSVGFTFCSCVPLIGQMSLRGSVSARRLEFGRADDAPGKVRRELHSAGVYEAFTSPEVPSTLCAPTPRHATFPGVKSLKKSIEVDNAWGVSFVWGNNFSCSTVLITKRCLCFPKQLVLGQACPATNLKSDVPPSHHYKDNKCAC